MKHIELTANQVDNLVAYLEQEQDDERFKAMETDHLEVIEYHNGKAAGLAIALAAIEALERDCVLYVRATAAEDAARQRGE